MSTKPISIKALLRKMSDERDKLAKAKKHISLTFSASVENHKGMEIISTPGMNIHEGFSVEECKALAAKYSHCSEYICLNDLLPANTPNKDKIEEAGVVIFRNGCKEILGIDPEECMKEQLGLKWDKKAFMYGRVVDKKARWNLCYADFSQAPDYEGKKGTVVDFKDLPMLSKVRKAIGDSFGKNFENLYAEGNYYYDLDKTYISFHNDLERCKIVCVKLGDDMPLYFRWYYKSEYVENTQIEINFKHGDIYLMSEKAVGHDGRKKNIYTLRHAAGNLDLMLNAK